MHAYCNNGRRDTGLCGSECSAKSQYNYSGVYLGINNMLFRLVLCKVLYISICVFAFRVREPAGLGDEEAVNH